MRRMFAAPIHPILTHFTIALTASSLAFDAFARITRVASLSEAGWWTIAAAVPITVGTLISGVTSRVRLPMAEGDARGWLRTHMALGPIFFGGLVTMAFWRWTSWIDGEPVSWVYLIVLGAVTLLMTVQGYVGGELVYRFGAEVSGTYERLPSAVRPSSVSRPVAEQPLHRPGTTGRPG